MKIRSAYIYLIILLSFFFIQVIHTDGNYSFSNKKNKSFKEIKTTQIDCSTPCISNNPCIISFCDSIEKICIEVVNITANNCCKTSQDCIQENECVVKQCNLDTNQCEIINVCSNNPTKKVCTTNSQCVNDDDFCIQSKCIDGFCQTSPLPNQNVGCCTAANECPNYDCSITYCNVDKFACFYVDIPGCSFISEISVPIETISRAKYYSTIYSSIGRFEAGEIAGATVGFSILFVLVLIFIFSILLMLSRPIFEKLNPNVDEKD